MAEAKQEISILAGGMTISTPINRNVYIQNFFKNLADNWETRGGFGVLTEFNSSMTSVALNKTGGSRISASGLPVGLIKCLGAYIIKTNFGHEQIVTLFLNKGNLAGDPTSGNAANPNYVKNDYTTFYSVIIYDITTNNLYEQIIYTHTSENATQKLWEQTTDMSNTYNHAYYEARGVDAVPAQGQNVSAASQFKTVKQANQETEAWFCEYQDKVIFGTTEMLPQVYEPSIFIKPKASFTKNILIQSEINDYESNPYGEESLITPLNLKDGQFTDGYSYIQQSEMPPFSDACVIANRVVYASGKSLYFSDPNVANAIIGDEIYTLDLDDDIKAICTWNNNILVWTDYQSAIYQPSINAALLSNGQATIVSNKVGCINPQAKVIADDGVYWISRTGVYYTNNGFNQQLMSESISMFFSDFCINPIGQYFTELKLSGDQSDYVYSFDNEEARKFTHIIFDKKFKQIIIVVPFFGLALILNKGWYFWNFSSTFTSNSEELVIGKTHSLDFPRLICRNDSIFMIGGRQTEAQYQPYTKYLPTTGSIQTWFTTQDFQITNKSSFVICEQNRGGALDRSTNGTYIEDWRYNAGYIQITGSDRSESTVRPRIFFDKLIPKKGLITPFATSDFFLQDWIIPEIGLDENAYLLPVRINLETDGVYQVQSFTMDFTYDCERWEPIGVTGSVGGNKVYAIYPILPTERAALGNCFGDWSNPTSPAPWIVAEEVPSNPDFLGSDKTGILEIRFDIAGYSSSPFNGLNLNQNNKNPLIYLPFKQKNNPNKLESTNTIITSFLFLTMDGLYKPFGESAAFNYNVDSPSAIIVWQNGNQNYHNVDYAATAVDWIYKSQQIGLDGENQIKARGTYSSIVSHGMSDKTIINAPYGLYNTLAGSDYKDYVTQLVDVASGSIMASGSIGVNNQERINIDTIRNRVYDSTQGLTHRIFDNGLTFGSDTIPLSGNFLVDAQELNTIATIDSVRGETVNYTFFGYLKNKAEKIVVNDIKAVIFPVGGRRRRGR